MIVRPFLTVTTFLKRKWPLALLILLLLWLAPPLMVAIAKGIAWALAAIARFAGEKTAAAVQKYAERFLRWLLSTPAACFIVIAPVLIFFPLIGAPLLAWC